MYDLAIIGLGAGGLEALKIAIKHDLKVIAFEKSEIGGKFLNYGNLAIKSIAYTTNFKNEINSNKNLGLNSFAKLDYDWQKILDKKAEIYIEFIKNFNKEFMNKFTLIKGEAELFINDESIEIFANDNIYQAKKIIVATGSNEKEDNIKIDNKFIITIKDIFKMQNLPKEIAIIGAQNSGVETALMLSNLGINVKIIEKNEGILNDFDIDIQKETRHLLKERNIEILEKDFIKKISNKTLYLNSGIAFETDNILITNKVSTLPKAGVLGCKENFILKPIEDYTTDIDNLYIIGSANNHKYSAQDSIYQAKCVMDKILYDKNIKIKKCANIINGEIEITSIGLREQDIKKEGYTIKKINISKSLNSLTQNDTQGFIKLILKDDIIKGAHIICKNATSFLNSLNLLIKNKINTKKQELYEFFSAQETEIITKALKE